MILQDASSLGLLTDLYQLTMAAGYFEAGQTEREAVFHLFFRKNPFGGSYAVACGLEQALELVDSYRFEPADVDYLAGLTGNDDRPLFKSAFLDYLSALEISVDIDAVQEGTVIFPHEPLLRVRGPLAQCQLLETALLTILNFQTLIATKASRVSQAAAGDPIIDFGLRRAQGLDGGLSASRAAYIGGCSSTSNAMAGRRFGIPLKGTHAHSWVMVFDSEPEAFESWAAALPNNCVFLVDTYDTRQGIEHAIHAAEKLRLRGHEIVGIRLDSGDLVSLSQHARQRLDAAGFPAASIVASDDLDEHRIAQLKADGAKINVWGVGTRLATAHGQPALGGVYKLSAIRDRQGAWSPRIKLSEGRAKTSNPGIQQVRRFSDSSGWRTDVIYDESSGLSDPCVRVDENGEQHALPRDVVGKDLLLPAIRGGSVVGVGPPVTVIRERSQAQLAGLDPAIRRLANPLAYPVGLDLELFRVKERLIAEAKSEVALATYP